MAPGMGGDCNTLDCVIMYEKVMNGGSHIDWDRKFQAHYNDSKGIQ